MTDRSLVARLRADIADYKSKMRDAQASTKAVGAEAAKASQSGKKSFDSWAKSIDSHEQSLSTLSKGFGGVGLAAAAGIGAAVKAAAGFDKSMSAVSATGSDARKNIGALRDEAIDMGAKTVFSASEAAGGIENLLKAGVSAQDVLGGGLKGSLDLAAAGELSVSDAAEIAATAMTQFNKTGKDVPHIADLLAAGAGKAQGDVSDLAQALNQSGLVASQFGLSIEDTTGTLAAFANAGLIGSDAGTSFKTMLLALANPSSKAASTMRDLGISAYDAQGNFVGVSNLAGQLHDKLLPLKQATRDQALAQIFGNDAVRAANVLMKDGQKGIDGWIKKTDDAGYAAKTAATRMDNLSGDVENLKGSLETAFIGAGEGQQSPLRELTQTLTDLINKWNELDDATKSDVARIAATLAIIGVGGAAVIKVVQGAAKIRTALSDLGAGKAAADLGRGERAVRGFGKAAGIATGAVIGLQILGTISSLVTKEFTPSIEDASNAIIDLSKKADAASAGKSLDELFQFQEGVLIKNKINGLGDALDKLSSHSYQFERDFSKLTGSDSLLGDVEKRFDSLDQSLTSMAQNGALAQAQQGFAGIAREVRASGHSVNEVLPFFDSYKATLKQQADQLGVFNLTQQDMVEWMGGKVPAAITRAQKKADAANPALKQTDTTLAGVSSSADDAQQSVDDLADSLFALTHRALDTREAEISFRQSVADAMKEAKKGKHTLDEHTQAGRDNAKALIDLARDSQNYIETLVKNNASTKKVVGATKDAREQFIRVATAMTGSKKEAERLADKYGLIPKNIKTKVSQPGMKDAQRQFDVLAGKYQSWHDKTVTLGFKITSGGVVIAPNGQGIGKTITKSATGGPIIGPGTGTSDDVLIAASNGEYMQTAAAHAYYGTAGMDAIRSQRVPKEVIASYVHGQYATGGPIDKDLILRTIVPHGGASLLDSVMNAAYSQAESAVKKNAETWVPSVPSAAGGSGVARWAPLILEALAMLDQPASLLGAVEHRMNQESGGNPNAINRWDSNAAAGHPSQGLMQTIPGTFAAYAGPFRSRGILDPMANIYAGLNYALHAYPSLYYAMMKPGGYANGTWSATPGWHKIAEKGAELVVEPQWKNLSGGQQVLTAQQTAALLSGGGKTPVIINFNAPMDRRGAAQEIKQLLEEDGRFTVGVGRG